MAKASKQKSSKTFDKTLRNTSRNEKPVHLPMSFEDAIKMAVNTDLSKSKRGAKVSSKK